MREDVRVHFAGFKNQSELPACYAAADALVLPSDNETWGLVGERGDGVRHSRDCVVNAVGARPI